ncbi:MAG: 6-bladed beta-propeller, partial [Calditrichaeota bacterium]|nr:6-bladed beta-propeller [Calditrichota bacterium]
MNFSLLFTMILLLITKSDDVKLSSSPLKKNAVIIKPVLTVMDEKDGFYESTISTVSSDGRLLVYDAGNHVMNIYDKSGKMLKFFGKEGNGPGEFSRLIGIYANKTRIVATEFRKAMIFDYSGKLIKEINERAGFGTAIILSEKDITFNFGSSEFSENSLMIFDLNGKQLKAVKNANHVTSEQRRRDGGFNEDRFREMMSRPRGLTSFGDKYVQFYPGEYKFEILDKNMKSLTVVTRDFKRIKELPEDENGGFFGGRGRNNNSKEAQQRRAQFQQMRDKLTGGYQDDIGRILG